MRRFINNLPAPAPPYTPEIIGIETEVVPFALGALEGRTPRFIWASDTDWRRGEQLIRRLQVALLLGGLEPLVFELQRLYRLIDNIHTGATYTVASENPLVIEPELPLVPDTTMTTAISLLGLLRGLPGILDAGWFGIGGRPATLADIVNGLRANAPETTTELFTEAAMLLDDTSDLASIGSFVTNLLGQGTEVVGEAGTALMISVLAASQIAMGQQLAGRLDRLVAGLDGGGGAPADNVLTALRGTAPAGAARNVIDAVQASASGITPADIDRIIAELQQIKAAL